MGNSLPMPLLQRVLNRMGRKSAHPTCCGFLESVYEEALAVEFGLCNVRFERQKSLDVIYKGTNVKKFICDLLIAETILVELKAIKGLPETDTAQVLNYLKATDLKLGLLLNFGAPSFQYKRLIN